MQKKTYSLEAILGSSRKRRDVTLHRTKKRDFLLQSSITSREKKFLTSPVRSRAPFSSDSKSSRLLCVLSSRGCGSRSISFHWHSARSILILGTKQQILKANPHSNKSKLTHFQMICVNKLNWIYGEEMQHWHKLVFAFALLQHNLYRSTKNNDWL